MARIVTATAAAAGAALCLGFGTMSGSTACADTDGAKILVDARASPCADANVFLMCQQCRMSCFVRLITLENLDRVNLHVAPGTDRTALPVHCNTACYVA